MYKGGRKDWSGEGGEDPGHNCYSQGHTLYILQKMVISVVVDPVKFIPSRDTNFQAIPDPTLNPSTK